MSAIIVDNTDAGAVYNGLWLTTGGGRSGTIHYTTRGNGTSAILPATLATPTLIRVGVTWPSDPGYAPTLPYTVKDGSTVLSTGTINQSVDPSGFTLSSTIFQSLGNFTFYSTNASVVFGVDTSGYSIVDAVVFDDSVVPSGSLIKVYMNGGMENLSGNMG